MTDVAPCLAAVSISVYVRGAAWAFAGNVTPLEAEPDVHGRVTGNPVTPGLELNLQVAASDTVADSVTAPPEGGRNAGVAVNEVIDGLDVGATVTVTGVAWMFPPPLTTSLNWYAFAVVLVFVGTVTSSETGPGVHGTVASPETPLGVAVNLHDVAVPPTVADSVTFPPVGGSVVGDAVKPVTVGAADA
jgi:hypothetical protein